jgi:5'-nucleotidase
VVSDVLALCDTVAAMSTPLFSPRNDRFVLAVDLDGVCADYTRSLRPYMAAMGRRDAFELAEPEDWNLVKAGWFETLDEYMDTHRFAVERGFFRTMEEIEGMSEALWTLSDAEVHIRIVTHRFLTHGDQGLAATDTIAWLQRRREDGRVRIPHRDLCFLGAKADASADLHLDDAPHQIEALRGAGENVLVFDQPYNRGLPGPSARGWGEVVEYVLAAQQRWQNAAN